MFGGIGNRRVSAGSTEDRRQHQRYPLCTSVPFYHAPSQRQFPGRCANISSAGMLMYVPASAPVQPGHPIRLNVSSVPLPELGRFAQDALQATVVRVDRKSLLPSGHLAIGVRFAEA